MTPEEFCRLTAGLWKWILDEGEHWTTRQTVEIVEAIRVLFIVCGGVADNKA